MGNLIADLRYTFLALKKNPGFAATAVLSLTLAIGASIVVFSFVNAILLRAIPYQDPDRLVALFETFRGERNERRGLSYPDYVDWRDRNQVFEQMAAYDTVSFTLLEGEPERVYGELVSANYFQLLGGKTALGRTFLPDEDRTPDNHPVAVISHSLWQRRFGSDPNVIGKSLRLNNRDFSVVGVMQEGFLGLGSAVGEPPHIWAPMMMISSVSSPAILEQRTTRWHQAVARLRPGMTINNAQSDLDSLTRRLEQTYPDSNRQRGGLVVGLQEELFGPIGTALLLLMGAVGFVVTIACANIANLLLFRATSRQKEFALRVALGASRKRLIQQLLTESTLLALVGGVLGLLAAKVSLNLVKAFIPINLPSFVNVDIDLIVFVYAFLISLITGGVCGLIPAWRASRPDPIEVIKEGGRGSAGQSGRLRNVLVVAEISLTLVLTVGAGLMIGSFQKMQKIDLGFNPENLLAVRFNLSDARYPNEKVTAFAEQLIRSAKSLPSVRNAGIGSDSPLQQGSSATVIAIEGRANSAGGNEVRIYRHCVTPGIFSTLGVGLVDGRDFTDQDAVGMPPVVIISESMARRYWPAEGAVGKRIKLGSINSPTAWLSIVGVVANVKFRNLIEPLSADPDVYFPLAQFPTPELNLLVKTSTEPADLIGALRREALKIDPSLPGYDIMTMKQRFKRQTAGPQFIALLLSIFTIIALLLSAIGVYGVLSYSMAQRAHEIAIRMALGARAGNILWLTLSQALKLTVIGLSLGLIAAFSLSGVMRSVLYGMTTTDLTTFIFASAILMATTLIASIVPVFRAIMTDPIIALRLV